MRRVLFITIGLVIVAISIGFILNSFEGKPLEKMLPVKQAINQPEKPEVAQQPSSKQTTLENINSDDEFPDDVDIFRAQFAQIADKYMDSAQFPVDSQPIQDPSEIYEPAPFEAAQFTIPFPMQSGRTLDVRVALDKFQYFEGETLQIQVNVKGAPADSYIDAGATIANANRDLPILIPLTSNNNVDFVSTVDTATITAGDAGPEMLLKVLVKVDGEEFFITQGFQFFKASAEVFDVGRAEVKGANLAIPLKIDVEESGYYFVRGVLRDAASDKPLLALQSEKRLSKGSRQLIFQAHIQALKHTGSEGPYTLTNIKLFKGAEESEQFDVPGTSREKSYQLRGFPFNQYDDAEHADPMALERAAFLRSLNN